jgi:DNA-binding transcriptional MerR regulator
MFDNLRRMQGQEFNLEHLVTAVNRQIAGAGLASDDERVAAQLDARTVRYYQTLGLVSKPARYDGRQAVYTYQHLLQLVAIKALQAQGLSLGQVQGWLPAQPVAALQAALAGSLTELRESRAPVSLAAPAPQHLRQPDPAFSQTRLASDAAEPVGLPAFRLAPGVTLLIDPDRVADPASLARRLKNLLEEMS